MSKSFFHLMPLAACAVAAVVFNASAHGASPAESKDATAILPYIVGGGVVLGIIGLGLVLQLSQRQSPSTVGNPDESDPSYDVDAQARAVAAAPPSQLIMMKLVIPGVIAVLAIAAVIVIFIQLGESMEQTTKALKPENFNIQPATGFQAAPAVQMPQPIEVPQVQFTPPPQVYVPPPSIQIPPPPVVQPPPFRNH